MADDAQYEYTSVQAIRGTEAKVIAKWVRDGWEVDSRDQGLLRTALTLRRVKPTTLASRALAAFRSLEPKVQRGVLAGTGAFVVLVIAGGVVAGMQAGGGVPAAAAVATDPVAEAAPSEKPSEDAAQMSEATTAAPVATSPAVEEILTVENNADLAALVVLTDPGAAAVGKFAAEYRGRTIEFDGNIAYMNTHGGYTTRYDLLIGTGDYSETTSPGPNFQFQDVNITNDLHLAGPNIPDTIGIGDNLRVVARVGDYNGTQALLFLEPVRTEVR
ncbi:DUF4839 domain-containing protein [Blastococcus sp. SYSU DS0617]